MHHFLFFFFQLSLRKEKYEKIETLGKYLLLHGQH